MLPLRFLLLALSWLVLATLGTTGGSLSTQALYAQSLSLHGSLAHGSPAQSQAPASGVNKPDAHEHQQRELGPLTRASLEPEPLQRLALIASEEPEGKLGGGPEPDDEPGECSNRIWTLRQVYETYPSPRTQTDRLYDGERIIPHARAPPVRIGFSS